jgi:hypothetical protein
MRVRVEKVSDGMRPHEVIVKIETVEGPQELVVDERSRSLRNNTIEIGYPIAHHDNLRLIELPTETASGTWRVWVDESSLIPNGAHQEAAE